MPNGDQKTVGEMAQWIRSVAPAGKYDKVPDTVLVDKFLSMNQQFRPMVKYELAAPTGPTTLGPAYGPGPVAPGSTADPLRGAGEATSIGPQDPKWLTDRPWYERWSVKGSEYLPPLAATVGALMGTPGGAGGALAGAMYGGAAGEASRQKLLDYLDVPTRPKDTLDKIERIGYAGLEQGVNEGVGQGIGRALPGFFEPGFVAGEPVSPKDITDMAMRDWAWGKGFRMTPGQIRGSPGGMLETLSGLGMVSKKATDMYRRQTIKAAEDLADHMLANLAGPATQREAGRTLEEALATAHAAFKAQGKIFFDEFRGTTGERIATNFDSVVQMAKNIEAQRTPMVKGKPKIIPSPLINPLTGQPFPPTVMTPLEKLPLEGPAGTLLNYAQNLLERPQNFKTAMEVRDFLHQYMGPERMFYDKDAEGIARRLWKELGDQLSRDAVAYDTRNPGAGISAKWEGAKAYWATGRERFDERFIVGLMDKEPEMVAASVKPGHPTRVTWIKDILNDYMRGPNATPQQRAQAERAWQKFQRAWAEENIIGNPMEAKFKLNDMQTMKNRLNEIGREQLNEIYDNPRGREFLRNARAVAELMSRTDFRGGLAAGKWEIMYEIINWTTLAGGGGAAGYRYGGPVETVGGAALGAAATQMWPRVLSAILHNRPATQLFLKMVTVPPTSKAVFTSAMTRLIELTAKGLIEDQDEIVRPASNETQKQMQQATLP